jgi:hypothetical protein
MTEAEKRKGGGSKLTRSETVTVRLDPKLRYLAELAARKQRRTLSSFIEWAVEDSLGRVLLFDGSVINANNTSVADEANYLWDVDEADRFAKLALRYPDMLTHDEQVRWKLIRENGYLWRGRNAGPDDEWTWSVEEGKLIFERLRESWDKFSAVALGHADKSTLPQWRKQKPKNNTGFDDMDDDSLPF